MIKKQISISLLVAAILVLNVSLVATTQAVAPVSQDLTTISANFIIDGNQVLSLDKFKVRIDKEALKSSSVIKLDKLGLDFVWPWNYQPLSEVYQFDFADRGKAYNNAKPIHLEITYDQVNGNYKQLFFYDGTHKLWRPLPSVDDPVKRVVSAYIHLSYARVALLSTDELMTVGDASWYRFKGGLFAASPDFKAGTILKVTNLENGKSVDVTVNDYGPDRRLHPDRVIDLDAVAFTKIASLGDGLVRVKIEPKKFVSTDDENKIKAAGDKPEINSKAAIVIRESDGQILFNKNASSTAPLASLTKLIAAQVFLDTKPSLDKVVSYSYQDEKYNYEYCKPWESARLRVKEGETMTIGDLLYSSLVGSANNAIESLVRVSGISRTDFIARMNAQAKAWGAVSTHFVEPTGLSPDNVSSPLDYAIMTKEIFKNPLLQKISTTPRYSFSTISSKVKHTLTNTNTLLLSGKYQISGSKTGYLDEAGYCLMTRVDTPAGKLIVVNFGAESKNNNFQDNATLLNYSLKQIGQ
ncbi:serine hydrolase [Patescibacteria group bacterium]|nr:serine hydrolase [Patescibacteria group bacterium]